MIYSSYTFVPENWYRQMDRTSDLDFSTPEMDYFLDFLEANLPALTLAEKTHPTNRHCSVAYDLVPSSEDLHYHADCLHLQEKQST
jgi:hypothetical protein